MQSPACTYQNWLSSIYAQPSYNVFILSSLLSPPHSSSFGVDSNFNVRLWFETTGLSSISQWMLCRILRKEGESSLYQVMKEDDKVRKI